jgi:Calcium/calmodulin dependent protein kinase II association domain
MTLNGPAATPRETYRARYSFDYELRDGAWLIVHHHSSVMPGDKPAQGDPLRDPNGAVSQKAPRTQTVASEAVARPRPQVAGFARRAIARATRSAQDGAGRDTGYEYRPARWTGTEFKF